MATPKKAKTKATTTTKKAAKKTAAAKHVAPKKKTASVAAEPAFFEARFTEQSLYWIIFGLAAITFALWLFSLDAKVRDLYDQIDANTYNMSSATYERAAQDKQ